MIDPISSHSRSFAASTSAMWFLFLEFGASLCPLPVLLSIYPDGFHLQII
ncbi:hypothetical protein V6Z11_D04G005100 [Gossypium hirsutum]